MGVPIIDPWESDRERQLSTQTERSRADHSSSMLSDSAAPRGVNPLGLADCPSVRFLQHPKYEVLMYAPVLPSEHDASCIASVDIIHWDHVG